MIYTGKSSDILKTLDDNSVDCVITDPPYSGFAGMESASSYCDWFEEHFLEMKRVCRSEQRIIVSQPRKRFNLFEQRFNFQSAIKIENAMQDARGADAYFLLQTTTSPKVLPNAEQWPGDIIPKSIHPNDRNIGKMAIIVKAMSNVGDVVLDPFCGSGAIGVACILLGRKYIGIELMKERAEDASRRIKAALMYAESTPNPY